MALKTLLLRSKLDTKKRTLETLRGKDAEYQRREKEFEDAIAEMTEDTPSEDRKEIEDQVEEFAQEKDQFEQDKKNLEKEIEGIEAEIKEEEEREKPKPAPAAGPSTETNERNGGNKMETRKKFFGMGIQERDAFFQREDVKNFLGEVRTCIKEKRALTNSGLIIPEVMLELLKEIVERSSKLLKYVSHRPVAGTARQVIMGSIPEAVWTEMCAALNELDLGFNSLEVDGYKVGGYFAVCNAIIEDNDVNLTSEILNALGTAIAKALDKAIVYGTGNKMPLGIVTRLAQAAKPDNYPATGRDWKDLAGTNIITGTNPAGAKLFKEIVEKTGAIDTDYANESVVWLMSKKTHMHLLAESIGANMNAAIVAGMNNTMPVVGGDIVELNFIPEGDIVFGYMGLYLLVERAGTHISQSEHARFIEDQTLFKGTARYDGIPAIPEGFALYNASKAPTTSGITFAGQKAPEAPTE
ncbi:phage major capsid protein [Murimonas intestini]|uniref:HK97 family phage major capsid protein n=1 Tax=Murimonas intestini TaxID=1337051 RepID=A0AB73SZG4_9FIRM|nr:phage major capsid protein [Murimonas intestini]MCR1842761.1 phage major capsid protein [Murimonas intestini]MCR1867900.1 phage major capsid protein [Murimonas intestini]MCR1885252.1 phage major capsid protein [Murimonas intestini]